MKRTTEIGIDVACGVISGVMMGLTLARAEYGKAAVCALAVIFWIVALVLDVRRR